jgi:hypothetical protein
VWTGSRYFIAWTEEEWPLARVVGRAVEADGGLLPTEVFARDGGYCSGPELSRGHDLSLLTYACSSGADSAPDEIDGALLSASATPQSTATVLQGNSLTAPAVEWNGAGWTVVTSKADGLAAVRDFAPDGGATRRIAEVQESGFGAPQKVAVELQAPGQTYVAYPPTLATTGSGLMLDWTDVPSGNVRRISRLRPDGGIVARSPSGRPTRRETTSRGR